MYKVTKEVVTPGGKTLAAGTEITKREWKTLTKSSRKLCENLDGLPPVEWPRGEPALINNGIKGYRSKKPGFSSASLEEIKAKLTDELSNDWGPPVRNKDKRSYFPTEQVDSEPDEEGVDTGDDWDDDTSVEEEEELPEKLTASESQAIDEALELLDEEGIDSYYRLYFGRAPLNATYKDIRVTPEGMKRIGSYTSGRLVALIDKGEASFDWRLPEEEKQQIKEQLKKKANNEDEKNRHWNGHIDRYTLPHLGTSERTGKDPG